ncbi:hypothetical protein [Lactococcus fujiensis]|uniref:hypothetical protein n=1 Tax=Lactococcus fujiensis TaxID=610251 RepID=UPI0006CFE2DA|nr:hypothetical protein [Lactococcus fujiensis]
MVTLHKKGLPAWVEVAADDTRAAIKFYTELFGWTSQSIGGLSGKMNPYQPTQWLTYIETDRIEQTIEDVKAHGGQIYMPRQKCQEVFLQSQVTLRGLLLALSRVQV